MSTTVSDGLSDAFNVNSEINGNAVSKSSNKAIKVVTFEDRRQENFTKGQAELERRRAALRDQQQREKEEQLAFECSEVERLERARIEQVRILGVF